MEITSITYLFFVGMSLFVYWFVPYKFQWVILLIDSVIFYFANSSPYTYIYVCVTALSAYLAGLAFGTKKLANRKKMIFTLTVIANVAILAGLKYMNMFVCTVNFIFEQNIGMVNVPPSLAVSYYTLQIIAYVVDCYLGSVKAEKNFFKLLLFTSFFPQMISGPISKWSDLGKQLFEEHRFDYIRVTHGMRRVLWGIGKKVVVADRMAIPVNLMFDNVEVYSGGWIIVAAICFVIELYFDFSGCMDIVIGVSECFGIRLAENFNSPFMSRTVQEFWQRWHVTLGGWLRDYIMYPISRSKKFKDLGRSCKKKLGKRGIQVPYYVAMFVVWTLMGVWHGSSWKYVIGEGWYFWIIIVGSQILSPIFKKIKKFLRIKDENILWHGFQILRTTILFALGNIAFRADGLYQALYMFKQLFVSAGLSRPLNLLRSGAFGGKVVMIGVVIIGLLQLICDVSNYNGKDVQDIITKQKLPVRWLMYFILTGIIILTGVFGKSQFIYFGF